MKVIFAVKDLAVQAFGIPFFVRSKGEAIRSFTDEANGKGSANSAIHAHPEDYELYELGVYDDEDAALVPHQKPIHVVRAKDLLIGD